MIESGRRSACNTLLGVCAAFLAACAAPSEPAPQAPQDPAGDVTRPTVSSDRAPAEPTHYLVETEIYELPLAIAEDLYGRADEREATIGTLIDESKCREALAILAPTNASIVHVKRWDNTVEIGKLEFILPRAPRSSSREDVADLFASGFASDHLSLQVRVTRSQEWTPIDLEIQLRWTDPEGRVLGRLPSAKSPMPDGYWMEIACLPSRNEGASAKTPALLVFLRLTPRAEPGDSISSSR